MSVWAYNLGRVLHQYDAMDQALTLNGGANLVSGVTNYYHATTGNLYRVEDIETGNYIYEATRYNVRGQAEEVLYGNGVTGAYTFEPETGRVLGKGAVNLYGEYLQDRSYQWDSVGNLKSRRNNAVSINGSRPVIEQSFCYDQLNRLTHAYTGTLAASCSGGIDSSASDVTTTTFDSFGNMRSKLTIKDLNTANTITEGSSQYRYGAANSDNYSSYGGAHALTQSTNTQSYNRYRYTLNLETAVKRQKDIRASGVHRTF